MLDKFKRAATKSETDLWLVALCAMLPATFVWRYGFSHGLWVASAVLYVIALLATIPAVILRVGLRARISFWEWAAIAHALGFGTYSLLAGDESLGLFTLIEASAGGILTVSAAYFVWRARRN